MGLKGQIGQWWNEKKMQMLTGMELQLMKYPEGDPRHDAIQEKIDNFRKGIEMKEADDGSNTQ